MSIATTMMSVWRKIKTVIKQLATCIHDKKGSFPVTFQISTYLKSKFFDQQYTYKRLSSPCSKANDNVFLQRLLEDL